MKRNLVIGLALISLVGCGGFSDSRFNPANWFGRGQDEAASAIGADPVDPALTDQRPLIRTIRSLEIERAAGGAIIRATGIAPTQGYFGAELVPLAGESPINGALVYFFRVEVPVDNQPVGAEQARVLTVARFVPDATLALSRSIVVRGAGNKRRSVR